MNKKNAVRQVPFCELPEDQQLKIARLMPETLDESLGYTATQADWYRALLSGCPVISINPDGGYSIGLTELFLVTELL